MNYCEACVYGRGKHAEWCESPPLRMMLKRAIAIRDERDAALRERLEEYFSLTLRTLRG